MTLLTHAALDAIFEPIGITTKRVDCGLQVGGVDITNRYMDKDQGGTATAATTNLQSGGFDISTIFAQDGTYVPGVVMLASYSSLALNVSGGSCQSDIGFESVGDMVRYSNNSSASQGTKFDIGDWSNDNASIIASDFEFRVGERVGDAPALVGSAVAIPTGAGNFSSWITVGADQLWYISTSGVAKSTVFTLEIREKANTANNDSTSMSLDVDGTGL